MNAMVEFRSDELPNDWKRTERVYNLAEQWYFRTREGINVGPYDTRFEAEIEASMIKELLRGAPVDHRSIEIIREFILDSWSMGRTLQPTFSKDRIAC